MTDKGLMLCAAAILAGCSSGKPAEEAPPPATGDARGPAFLADEAEAGAPAPDFRLSPVDGGASVSLGDTVRASAGRPTVLVLGEASCSFSRQQLNDLAAARPGYRLLAVVQGTPAEVLATLPAGVPFPVLVDGDGSVLGRYRVAATPSVVVLDGSGSVAYIGGGGYLPPAAVADLAGRVARGEKVDAGAVKTEGG